MTVIDEIAAERKRQIDAEGYTDAHDIGHGHGELAAAGAYYAVHWIGELHPEPDGENPTERYVWFLKADQLWPWAPRERKPKDARRDLIRAAALIVAEIERLDFFPPPETGRG